VAFAAIVGDRCLGLAVEQDAEEASLFAELDDSFVRLEGGDPRSFDELSKASVGETGEQ
jgi:hypothetical protein